MKRYLAYKQPEEVAAYLAAIVNNAIDAIFTINEHGIVETMNMAAEKLFGFSADEVVGNNIKMLMPSPDRELHDGYIERYKSTGQPRIIGIGREVEGLKKTGERFPCRLAVSETQLSGRRIFTGIIHDLTREKEQEAKILRLNEELESKVRQRTEELAEVVNKLLDSNQKLMHEVKERKSVEEALRKSEKELRKALAKEQELSQLKSRFVTMASHEFRTPLSAILSSADLIEAYTKESPDDKRIKHINRIKAAVNNLTNILNDFLSLSKLEEDKVQVHSVELVLTDFCSEVTDEIKGLLKPGQHIRHPNGVDSAVIYLDKKILKNILYNLLSNAIKYSEAGKPIDCFIGIEEGNLNIKITDYGIGIPEEDQQHLFTRFFRAHNVENIQGTGLGLNIVRRYLDLLDGEITFQSRSGEGTTFEVKIPLGKMVDKGL